MNDDEQRMPPARRRSGTAVAGRMLGSTARIKRRCGRRLRTSRNFQFFPGQGIEHGLQPLGLAEPFRPQFGLCWLLC